MREIKFRAWNKITKEMLPDKDSNNESYAVLATKHKDIYSVMQFTGLKDKNKEEIYEGDIALLSEVKHEVRFYNGSFMLFKNNKPYIYNVNWNQIEVIGNIYENKELLND